jgi:hypothetical protein
MFADTLSKKSVESRAKEQMAKADFTAAAADPPPADIHSGFLHNIISLLAFHDHEQARSHHLSSYSYKFQTQHVFY